MGRRKKRPSDSAQGGEELGLLGHKGEKKLQGNFLQEGALGKGKG